MTKWLPPNVAAEMLSVPLSTFNRLVHQGKLPAPSYAMGPKLPRWDAAALDRAMSGAANSDLPSDDADEATERFRHVAAQRAKRSRRSQAPR